MKHTRLIRNPAEIALEGVKRRIYEKEIAETKKVRELTLPQVDKPYNIIRVLGSFYALSLASCVDYYPSLLPKFREYATKTARTFCGMLLEGSLLELRHRRSDSPTEAGKKALILFNELGVLQYADREDIRGAVHNIILQKTPVDLIEVVTAGEILFLDLEWSEAYGGVLWARIIRTVGHFLTRTYPDHIIADRAFQLQHNSGSAFNKNKEVEAYLAPLSHQLNKKKLVTELDTFFTPHFLLEPEISDLIENHALLRRNG